jgi:choline-sulfatase
MSPDREKRDASATAARRQLARILLAAAALLAGSCTAQQPLPEPERIVLVSIDTLRADRLGAYGWERAHTPTLDGLAAGGVLFERAVSPVPLTLPSHTTLMTGLEPPRHGVRHNSIYRVPDDLPTLAEGLRGRGYATAGFVAAAVLERSFGLARGFDHYDDTAGAGTAGGIGYAERPADEVADAVLAWLDEAPDRFFLWVHFYDPHAGYEPPPGFALAGPTPYDGEIAFADHQLGRILGAVDERFGADGTLVVATSDHGEGLGDHYEISHSYSLYAGTQNIPLLMRGPGVPPGLRLPDVVSLSDLAPTLLELAGAPELEADGRSLVPLLRGGALAERAAYSETLAPRFDFDWSPLLGLRTREWSYVRAPKPELYDLALDPGEAENLAAQREDVVADLDAELAARLEGARVAPGARLEGELREQIESLGYVVPQASSPDRRLDEIYGPDPKDRAPQLVAFQGAERLLRANRPAEALAALEAAWPEHPGRYFHLARAAAAFEAGHPTLAEASARSAQQMRPSSDAAALLGMALEAQGKSGAARGAYLEALSLGPSPHAEVGLGRMAEAAGRPDEAERHYVNVLAHSHEARWRLAALEIRRGNGAAASAHLEALPEAVLAAPGVALYLAQAELEAGDREAALARIAMARATGEAAAQLDLARATILLGAGRPEEALQALPSASSAPGPLTGRIEFVRAAVLAELGRHAEARAAMALSLAAPAAPDPDEPWLSARAELAARLER